MKKILFGTLLTIILSVNLFGVFGVATVHAAADSGKNDSDPNTVTQKIPGDCGVVFGDFGWCIAYGFEYIITTPANWLAIITGKIFDFTIGYSLNSSTYDQDFVRQGWGIVRDISNMFFIFLLLFAGIAIMLDIDLGHHYGGKAMIPRIIVIALMVNFSLFTTRVLIDAGNIGARVFFNNIVVADKSQPGKNFTSIDGSYPSVSTAIANQLKIQETTLTSVQEKIKAGSETAKITPGTYILLSLISAVLLILASWIFIAVGFLFIGRIIGLWMAMIFSPFAFVSYILPSLSDMEMIGWKKWWPDTMKLAFTPIIFCFFLYILIIFLKSGFSIFGDTQYTTATSYLASILIPALIAAFLLLRSLKIAKDMGGAIGNGVFELGKLAGGLALGAATGGAALGLAKVGNFVGNRAIGQTAIGRSVSTRLSSTMALKEFNSDRAQTLRDNAAKGDKGAQKELAQLQKRSTQSKDFLRQNSVVSGIINKTGMNMDNPLLNSKYAFGGALGSAYTAGGAPGMANRQAEKERKMDELLGVDKAKKKEAEDKLTDRKEILEKAQSAKTTLEDELRIAKLGENKEEIRKATEKLSQMNTYLDVLKNGFDDKKSTHQALIRDDIGFTRYDSKLESFRDPKMMDRVAFEKKDKHGNLTGEYKAKSVSKEEGDIKNFEHKRFNDYMANSAEKSGIEYHDRKYDSNGNISSIGHPVTSGPTFKAWKQNTENAGERMISAFDKVTDGQTWKDLGGKIGDKFVNAGNKIKTDYNGIKKNIRDQFQKEAEANKYWQKDSHSQPIQIVGDGTAKAAAWAHSPRFLMNAFSNVVSGGGGTNGAGALFAMKQLFDPHAVLNAESAHISTDFSHKIHDTKSSYKPVNSHMFGELGKIFGGIGGGSGGAKAHADHGHDDHGGDHGGHH